MQRGLGLGEGGGGGEICKTKKLKEKVGALVEFPERLRGLEKFHSMDEILKLHI